MNRLTLHLLGAPAIRLNDQPMALKQRKALALFVYLAITGKAHQRETLATLLWPEYNVERGRANLRRTLWLLKQTLSEGWLETEGEDIGLGQGADVWIDVQAFKLLLAQKGAPSSSLPSVDQLEQAVALYHGDFLTGFSLPDSPAFDEWQFFEAQTAREALTAALDALVTQHTQALAYETALGHARRRLALDPLHEPAHQTLMRLYALSGRQTAALRQFDECQRILHEDLGVEPEPATQALATAIREKRLAPPEALDPAEIAVRKPSEDESPPHTIPPRPVFVGRETQLSELDDALAQALVGQGQLRIVTGEAGAGKSALISEFLYRAHGKQPNLLSSSGACDAQTGPFDPFLPFREVLLKLLENTDPDASSKWNPDSCLVLLQHGPDLVDSFIPPADRPNLVARAQAAGWQGERHQTQQASSGQQSAEQNKIIEQCVAIFGILAAQHPLIIVLEDLHWADAASLGLLFRLSRQLADHRLLVLGTNRSEQAHLPEPDDDNDAEQPRAKMSLAKMLYELQRHQGQITIDLETARQAEGRAWVDGLLDSEANQFNESFRQALYQHTGGHPLFVVELLADLKQSGALNRDQVGRWRIGDALDWRNLPVRVGGAIAGRIAHLSTEQRWLLTIASISGERFLADMVAHVAGSETRQVARELSQALQDQHRLVEAEGVERLGAQRLTRYRFRHHLIQVYLYEQLDEVQRIYLHEDVARALEILYGAEAEQIAVPLAHHFQTAGVKEKAVAYLILAGEQAMSLSAYREATQHFSQAISLLAELSESPEWQQQAFSVQFNLGKVGEAIHGIGSQEAEGAYSHALVLGRQLGDMRLIIQVLLPLTHGAQFRAESERARTYGEECLHLAEELQDPELLMLANQALQVIAHGLGHHGQAVTSSEPVIAFYQSRLSTLTFDEVYKLVFTLGVAGLSLVPAGYPDRALRQAQEGLVLAQEHEHHYGIAGALGCIAGVYGRRGQWRDAKQFGQAQRDFSETHHFSLNRTFGELHLGAALAMLGEVDRGIVLVNQAIAERQAMGINIAELGYIADLGQACGRVGRVAEGLGLVDKALAEMEVCNDRQSEAKIHQIKGDLLLLQDPPASEQNSIDREAEVCFRRAIEVAQDQQAKLWEARALASLCHLLHSQGRDEGCRQQLADLYAWFTEGFETEDLQVVQTVLREMA